MHFHIQYTNTPKCFDLLQIICRKSYVKEACEVPKNCGYHKILILRYPQLLRTSIFIYLLNHLCFFICLSYVRLPEDEMKKIEIFRTSSGLYVEMYTLMLVLFDMYMSYRWRESFNTVNRQIRDVITTGIDMCGRRMREGGGRWTIHASRR